MKEGGEDNKVCEKLDCLSPLTTPLSLSDSCSMSPHNKQQVHGFMKSTIITCVTGLSHLTVDQNSSFLLFLFCLLQL